MICMMVAGNEPQTPSFLPFQSARAFHAFVAVHADARCNSESTGAKKCQVDQFQSNHSSISTMTFVVIVMVHLLISSPSSSHPWSWRYRGTPSSCSCAACLFTCELVSNANSTRSLRVRDCLYGGAGNVRCCLEAFSTLVAMPYLTSL
jgi:hypothetical protein